MPGIVDYPTVLKRMQEMGLRCLYHNSGAFGFASDVTTHAIGWIGPDDPTIRPAARPLVRSVPPPYEIRLTQLILRAWKEILPGPLWLMPKSHWAYELEFGNVGWLPGALRSTGIDPAPLASLNNAAAAAFEPGEEDLFIPLAEALLKHLAGSDFAIAFPGRPVLCTLHHHKQLWWITTDKVVAGELDRLLLAMSE